MAKNGKYPLSSGVKRPYRLWNAKLKAHYPYRCFKHMRNAHVGALIEARWEAVGAVIEVYDARVGRLLGQYIRRTHTIDFLEA